MLSDKLLTYGRTTQPLDLSMTDLRFFFPFPVFSLYLLFNFFYQALLILTSGSASGLFVLRFYGPVNPMGSCRARSVYLTTHLLGRLSPLSG